MLEFFKGKFLIRIYLMLTFFYLFQMASLPHSRSGTYTSTDTENSDTDNVMLESCSLQEINQEDLAAILPDQQDCDAFGEFECRVDKNSTQTGDASGSDMELPQQAVNALIQRTTESSSESESHPPPNPSSLYANSLLKQFVAQTQLLNTSYATLPNDDDVNIANNNSENVGSNNSSGGITKRKRGRPKKIGLHHNNKKESGGVAKKTTSTRCSINPNVSPDSGIQNSPDHTSSPEPCLSLNTKTKYVRENKKNPSETSNKNSNGKLKEQNKLPITSNRFDRLLYANADRVLYPPRRKAGRPPIITRKGPGRPPKYKTTTSTTEQSNDNEKSNGKVSKTKKCNTTPNAPINLNNNSAKVNGVKETTATKKAKSKLLHDICERVSKRLELSSNRYLCQKDVKQENKYTKSNTRRQKLDNKLKVNNFKAQFTTLKNAKLMHSKHKHKKHKKCKFKILKPLTATTTDTKINIDIEKLVADFVKSCCISSTSKQPAKENIPEILKTLKKVSKKRKTSEYTDRKKKKQTISNVLNKETNSNEQRLPLKKRHYHLSAGSESKPDLPETTDNIDEIKTNNKTNTKVPIKALTATNNLTTKNDNVTSKTSPTNSAKYIGVIKTTPPKITTINNNEYENVNSVDCHIDEAIEACITRFSEETDNKKTPVTIADDKTITTTSITTTTPKKRHRFEQCTTNTEENSVAKQQELTLSTSEKESNNKTKTTSLENVVNELKMKRTLTCKVAEKKTDTAVAAQIMTRKKNRLEDLTSTLVTKIIPNVTTENTDNQKRRKVEEARDSVIKYPTCKKVTEKLDFIDAKPTGIFVSSTDLEVLIPVNKIELKSEETKTENTTTVAEGVPPTKSSVIITDTTRKKIRKRRAINRTGFPTVKKKKKKVLSTENTVADTKGEECDRVPKTGEEYSKFVQRTEKSYTVTETTIQKSSSSEISSDVENTKWEGLSECDSLPQEERTEIEHDDVKMSLRSRDLSPATSVDTISEDKCHVRSNFTMKEDLDELPLELRIQRMEIMKARNERRRARKKREMLLLKKRKYRENVLLAKKRKKLREVSPASSIEQFLEKRMKEERASPSSDEFRRIKKVPRWRKRYLVAGLFSDYYKEDE